MPQRTSILTDVPWIQTTSGPKTVRQALLESHQITDLDQTRLNPVEYMATFRALSHIAAVVFRHTLAQEDLEAGELAEVLSDEPLTETAVDAALAQLTKWDDLFDPVRPALQMPLSDVLMTGYSKDGPYIWDHALPYGGNGRTSTFWNLAASDERRDLSTITLNLAVVAMYSASNNGGAKVEIKADGESFKFGWSKPQTMAPGYFTSAGKQTQVEVIVSPGSGRTLLGTLLCNTPEAWVIQDTTLPGWLDRSAEAGMSSDGTVGLWEASWAFNAVATKWNHDGETPVLELLQRCGVLRHAPGVPTWDQGTGPTPETAKVMISVQNHLLNVLSPRRYDFDPHYLHLPRGKRSLTRKKIQGKGKPKIEVYNERKSFGDVENNSFLVKWYAESANEALTSQRTTVLDPGLSGRTLTFHVFSAGGQASTPRINSSRMRSGRADDWTRETGWMKEAGEQALSAVRMIKEVKTDHSRDALAPHQKVINAKVDQAVAAWGLSHLDVTTEVFEQNRQKIMGDLHRRINRPVAQALDHAPSTSLHQMAAVVSEINRKTRGILGLQKKRSGGSAQTNTVGA